MFFPGKENSYDKWCLKVTPGCLGAKICHSQNYNNCLFDYNLNERNIYHHVIFLIHLKTVIAMLLEFYGPLIEYNGITLTNSGLSIGPGSSCGL